MLEPAVKPQLEGIELVAAGSRARGYGGAAWFRLLRARHWIKNLFVLIPVAFTPSAWNRAHLVPALYTLAAFSATCSAAYIWNDYSDLERDKLNPKKCMRPLASGEIAIPGALCMAAALLFVAIVLGLGAGLDAMLILGTYAVLQLLYSASLKHVVVLDVMVLASGFLLRVLAGGASARIPLSHWLFLTTSLLALFLGFAKRRQEILLLGDSSPRHRAVLAEYSIEFIDQMLAVLAACCIVCYGLYTGSSETTLKFGTNGLVLTLPFVIYGLLRYLYLLHKHNLGDNPTDLVWSDRPLQACIALWLATFFWVLYSRPVLSLIAP